ncbi:phage-related holin [Paenibacillus sp. 1182]|nr:phage-related holin [Paenibacillus sp. 1182]
MGVFKFCTALGSSAVTYFYGGWSGVLGVLLALVIIDYVTGLFAAAVEGKKGTGPGLKSKIGLIGIARQNLCTVAVSGRCLGLILSPGQHP